MLFDKYHDKELSPLKGSPSLDLSWFPYSIHEGQAAPFDSEELGKGNGSEEALGVRMKAECLLAVFRKAVQLAAVLGSRTLERILVLWGCES